MTTKTMSRFSLLSGAMGAAALFWLGPCVEASWAGPAQGSLESLKSSPPDSNRYTRPLSLDDRKPLGLAPLGANDQATPLEKGKPRPRVFLADVVVSNTDPNLTNTDVQNDGETSIAINPRNPREIVISAFSGSWGANAPIYHTRNGGRTWTRQFSVPLPPGWDTGCPCDWTFDYGRRNELSGTILASTNDRAGFDVVTGTTTNPALPAAFQYFDPPGPPVRAQETNINVPTSLGNADQPWLLVNRDPRRWRQDNVYVAWDDFANSDGVDGVDMRVAVSYGLNPPRFTQDRQVGNSIGGVNPGLRLADNRRKGTMWALWGRNIAAGPGGSKNMNYMLNRSTDGGNSWSLNGNALGIAIANADSTQPQPKFGTVNALLGGVHHAAADPRKGDVYYVYGNRDPATGNDRLAIRRLTTGHSGNITIGPERFVTGQVEAAIPQVAVTHKGTVGVFYYTFDGFSATNFPTFTAHLALSRNRGATFTDIRLLTFLSSAQDNGDPRQRVLGDYMQMKALGDCFYGAFTANGVAFGRPFANHDPIFFKTCA